MTATIAPADGMTQLVRSDPELRLADYCEALRWNLSLPDEVVDRVILLENSGSDLRPFAELARAEGTRKRIEFLSTDTGANPACGKGYAESLMIEEGLAKSQLLKPDSPFWKVTGRLRVLNFAAMIRGAPDAFDLYCDLRDVPLIGDALGGNQWMETRLFATTPAAYMRLFGGKARCYDTIEKKFYPLVRAAMAAGQNIIHPRFRRQPILDGVCGGSGAEYRSPSYRTKEMIRAAGRLVAPRLWL
jgi:hypothetical protein